MVSLRQGLRYAGIGVVALVLLVVLAYLLGILGVPSVTGVENRFGPVNSTDTVIETNLSVHNPNPIGIRLGGTTVDYTVAMNEVRMATGRKSGLSLGAGDSILNFTTYLRNERIPDWWYAHVTNGEVTEVVIDADVSVGLLLGGTFDFETNETVETDILSGFNSTETRPINLDLPIVSDPALYLNRTAGRYGDNLTRDRTPIETSFTVYNPKPWPYTITEIGYEVRMNDVTVGSGQTERAYTLPPGRSETLAATSVIRNDRLDEWWVSHLQNDQVTDLTVDFYVMVRPEGLDVAPIRLDVDAFDFTTIIRTDIFGNKDRGGSAGDGATDGGGDGVGTDGDDGAATPTERSGGATDTSTDDGGILDGDTSTQPPTSTQTPTDDGGILDGGDDTATPTDPAPTPTATPTTTTDDGGILPLLLGQLIEM